MTRNDMQHSARDDDLIDAFFHAARRNANRSAIIHNGKSLSYERLSRLVRTGASRLGSDCGVVCVQARRSLDTVIALLSVLSAHGVYCPIDPSSPADRQRALIRAAGCRVVISSISPFDAPHGVRLVDLPTDDAGLALPVEGGEIVAPDRMSAAYIIFTSGSTGTPNAVVTPRGAISTVVQSLRQLFAIDTSDRVLQFASLTWDTCFEEIFPTLTTGATLIVDDEAYTGSFPRLLRMIDARRITVMDLPTAFWHELVRYLVEEQCGMPESVRLMIIGGEAARPARLAEWYSLDTGRIRLVNTYGCTETTLITHAVDLHGPCACPPEIPWADARAVPIGRRLPHVIEHIDDTGELFIGGPSLALEYRGMPEVTAKRFVLLDRGDDVQRYFRTGDCVTTTASGDLIHQGRLDSQIKVRGVRVNPGEVEAAIAKHPGVATVAVTSAAIGDHMMMVAYVVLRSDVGATPGRAELLTYLRLHLPHHLVPSRVVTVPELMYTASGKIDRRGCQQRYAHQLQSKEAGL